MPGSGCKAYELLFMVSGLWFGARILNTGIICTKCLVFRIGIVSVPLQAAFFVQPRMPRKPQIQKVTMSFYKASPYRSLSCSDETLQYHLGFFQAVMGTLC